MQQNSFYSGSVFEYRLANGQAMALGLGNSPITYIAGDTGTIFKYQGPAPVTALFSASKANYVYTGNGNDTIVFYPESPTGNTADASNGNNFLVSAGYSYATLTGGNGFDVFGGGVGDNIYPGKASYTQTSFDIASNTQVNYSVMSYNIVYILPKSQGSGAMSVDFSDAGSHHLNAPGGPLPIPHDETIVMTSFLNIKDVSINHEHLSVVITEYSGNQTEVYGMLPVNDSGVPQVEVQMVGGSISALDYLSMMGVFGGKG